MTPHFIVNEKAGYILQFTFDFEKLTTLLSLQKPTVTGFEKVKEIQIDNILRWGVSIGDCWYVATIKDGKHFDQAFIEEWRWDTLSILNKYPIEYTPFGLMKFSMSPKGDTVVIDRFFVEANRYENGCKIFSFPDFTELISVPINSNLQSPTFDASGNKLVLIHTDQGGAQTMLFERKGERFEKQMEFAQRQVRFDMTYTAVVHTVQGIALLSYSINSTLGLYDETTGKCKFKIDVEQSVSRNVEEKDPDFDYENFDLCICNSDLTFYADGTHSYVGGTGKIVKINHSSGLIDATIDLPALLYIIQVRKLNHELIVMDHKGNLEKISI